jgi:hypothetical protein
MVSERYGTVWKKSARRRRRTVVTGNTRRLVPADDVHVKMVR